MIVEPVVQGAGGMRFHDPRYLHVLRELCLTHDVLLVFDEIATGFGRTGSFFAADHAERRAGRHVRRQGADRRIPVDGRGAVHHGGRPRDLRRARPARCMHGPTFMGNPLAAAVALASIRLLLERGLAGRGAARSRPGCGPGSRPHGRCPGSSTCGCSARSASSSSTIPSTCAAATAAAAEQGVWLRPFRDLVYTMPPYVCDPGRRRRDHGGGAGGGRGRLTDGHPAGWCVADMPTSPGGASATAAAAAGSTVRDRSGESRTTAFLSSRPVGVRRGRRAATSGDGSSDRSDKRRAERNMRSDRLNGQFRRCRDRRPRTPDPRRLACPPSPPPHFLFRPDGAARRCARLARGLPRRRTAVARHRAGLRRPDHGRADRRRRRRCGRRPSRRLAAAGQRAGRRADRGGGRARRPVRLAGDVRDHRRRRPAADRASASTRLGRFAQAIPPAVVHGMLAGIGVTIALAQLHVVLGGSPAGERAGERAGAARPARSRRISGGRRGRPADDRAGRRLADARPVPRRVPGPLVAIVAATLLAWRCFVDVARVDLPGGLLDAIALPLLPHRGLGRHRGRRCSPSR